MADDPIQVRKIAAVVPFSAEFLRMLDGTDDDRPGHMEPPAPDEVEAYKRWKAKFGPLLKKGRRKGWFYEGGPDYGFEYQPPRGEWIFDDEEPS